MQTQEKWAADRLTEDTGLRILDMVHDVEEAERRAGDWTLGQNRQLLLDLAQHVRTLMRTLAHA